MPTTDKESSQPVQIGASHLWVQSQLAEEAGSRAQIVGQVPTPIEIARAMAGWITPPPDSSAINILDPGSGEGILSTTLVEALVSVRHGLRICVEAYEIDEQMARATSHALTRQAEFVKEAGSSLRFEVHASDYLADWTARGPSLDGESDRFDVVIQNPPYSKLRKDSFQSFVAGSLVHGQPNIYGLFLVKAARQLRPQGQMVAVSPRSWLSGAYFRRVRQDFFRAMALERVHTFESRSEAFRRNSVLQETIIFHARRASVGPRPHVEVSTSQGLSDLGQSKTFTFPWSFLCPGGPENPIRLPESIFQVAALRELNKYSDRLATFGLRVLTGPVVGFRSREHTVELASSDSNRVPLIWLEDVGRGRLLWEGGSGRRHPPYLERRAATQKLILPAEELVLVRRFSAKEDRHRVIACRVRAGELGPLVAVENKVNIIRGFHGAGGASIARAVCSYLNSEIVDQYIRAISGTTQVNAYELASLPFPPTELLLNRWGQGRETESRLEAA